MVLFSVTCTFNAVVRAATTSRSSSASKSGPLLPAQELLVWCNVAGLQASTSFSCRRTCRRRLHGRRAAMLAGDAVAGCWRDNPSKGFPRQSLYAVSEGAKGSRQALLLSNGCSYSLPELQVENWELQTRSIVMLSCCLLALENVGAWVHDRAPFVGDLSATLILHFRRLLRQDHHVL
jgi:hypothetical protein